MSEEFEKSSAPQEHKEAINLPHQVDFNRGNFTIPFFIWMDSGRIKGQVDYQGVSQTYGYENTDARNECVSLKTDIVRSLKIKFGEENITETNMGFSASQELSNNVEQLINAVKEN